MEDETIQILRELSSAYARGTGLRLNNAGVQSAANQMKWIIQSLRHAAQRTHESSKGCDGCLDVEMWIDKANLTSTFSE